MKKNKFSASRLLKPFPREIQINNPNKNSKGYGVVNGS